jgi:hypothetical protein
MTTLEQIAAKLRGREFVAKHPRTGKWHGMDRILRCPITEGYETKAEAEAAWRMEKAREIGDIATRSHKI